MDNSFTTHGDMALNLVDLEKYPNAESNWKNSIDRKIALLRYFKSKNIRNPNEYNLQIKSISLSRDRFKGFEVNNEKSNCN